jgi:AraC family transcriptional regulator, transcriptional activator of the genes for pyochelin and ferripyochelin receptors
MRVIDINLPAVMQELHLSQTRSAQPELLAVGPTDALAAAFSHQKLGDFWFKHLLAPGLHVSFVDWQVPGEDFRLEGNEETADITLNFQVSGHLFSHFDSLQHPLDMRPGRHNLIHTPEPGEQHLVKSGDRIQMCHFSISPATFRHYLDENEAWTQPFLQKLERKEPFSASPSPLGITPAMIEAIGDLKHCVFTGHARRLFLEAKTTELLVLHLDQVQQQVLIGGKSQPLQRGDIEKLHALKTYLDQHFLQEFTLALLCTQFGLNEFKLKKGFKLLFGTTVFGYIQELRMQQARLLLLERVLNVNEVADKLGYTNPNHFSTAFKKHFGMSPGGLVRGARMKEIEFYQGQNHQ